MRKPLRIPRFFASPLAGLAAVAFLSGITAFANPATNILARQHDFDKRSMLLPAPGAAGSGASFSTGEPGRFSMRQSYSLTAMSGPGGSLSSGLYLNTLSYRLSLPLVLFADVGFYTPLHSSMPGMRQDGAAGSLVLPRIGLEYKPSERVTVNLELVNGPDAWKAYGGMPWSSHSYLGSLNP